MPTLGYWKTKGLAQPIRLLLTYAGVEFEDVQYEQGPPPDFSRESWYSVKQKFGEILSFPNVKWKPDFFKNLPPKLEQFENHLGVNDWFAGHTITSADFSMYEILDQLRRMQTDSLNAFPKLQAFLDRFESLPKVKEYLSLDKVKNLPINSKIAAFK